MALLISKKTSKYYKMTCIFDGCNDVITMDDLEHHIKIHVVDIVKGIDDIQN
ncbi:hypothetical protein BD31_I0827 [Candidatus Nitrosopumilus salaria BD31]|uniref:Uncharacterized protein n=1 Tax=Candidatus Nitrosopumilus salarius BD31 TaxID=859350 RepID=I3D230_9ARCH|nr:hypothetical protein [Candidatus Nitrosopumilus salaria]EIJ65773.1 hypothetical protein BD31_I0827 [Candidatus Nitrosopumilus salaria BD31]